MSGNTKRPFVRWSSYLVKNARSIGSVSNESNYIRVSYVNDLVDYIWAEYIRGATDNNILYIYCANHSADYSKRVWLNKIPGYQYSSRTGYRVASLMGIPDMVTGAMRVPYGFISDPNRINIYNIDTNNSSNSNPLSLYHGTSSVWSGNSVGELLKFLFDGIKNIITKLSSSSESYTINDAPVSCGQYNWEYYTYSTGTYATINIKNIDNNLMYGERPSQYYFNNGSDNNLLAYKKQGIYIKTVDANTLNTTEFLPSTVYWNALDTSATVNDFEKFFISKDISIVNALDNVGAAPEKKLVPFGMPFIIGVDNKYSGGDDVIEYKGGNGEYDFMTYHPSIVVHLASNNDMVVDSNNNYENVYYTMSKLESTSNAAGVDHDINVGSMDNSIVYRYIAYELSLLDDTQYATVISRFDRACEMVFKKLFPFYNNISIGSASVTSE